MQQADGVVGSIVGAKGIGADQLGKAIGAMGLRHPLWPHFVQHDPPAGTCYLPSGLRTGKAGADDVDRIWRRFGRGHRAGLARFSRKRI
jgi:hypothetical protein